MTSSSRPDKLFKYRHFDRQIIILCVRWYLSYKLSYWDLVEMMAERGVEIGWKRRTGAASRVMPL